MQSIGQRVLFVVFSCVVLAGLAGCGRGGPAMVPVSGRVTLDGTPLDGATVMLIPEDGRPATGVSNAQGAFRMTTVRDQDGAVPGTHRVTVSLIKLPDKAMSYELADSPESLALVEYVVPQKYGDPKTSGLTVEVRRGMEPLELNLTR